MPEPHAAPAYADVRGRRALVAGGLGFIGSTLTRRLVELGAAVTVLDSLHPEHGGNRINLAGLEDAVRIEIGDAADLERVRPLVASADYVFNLAGQVSHMDSMTHPLGDLASNTAVGLALLEACRLEAPEARVVFTSTRQVYGRAERLPVDEGCPVRPVDVNGIHKAAVEAYHRLYHELYGIATRVLRLTNTYGPRQLIRHARQGFVPWFVRMVLVGDEITLYRPGTALRDFCYVDDAVDAILRAADLPGRGGEIFNVGGFEALTLRDFTETLIRVAGAGRYRLVEYPADRRPIEIGDIIIDDRRLREVTGWAPRVSVAEGLARMLDYYRHHGVHYGLPEAC